ncbi:hypothetical protein OIU79_020758 [Salix purpurea]|uniref:Peroxin-7 n=1 Tax=Salix purpurea TaxID=77065 RepID=A0A9Q0WQN2_SALPP|nr:hypothetical protein OIU79_020758 [Salix purpurea]
MNPALLKKLTDEVICSDKQKRDATRTSYFLDQLMLLFLSFSLHPAWFSCKTNNLFLRISSRRRHFPELWNPRKRSSSRSTSYLLLPPPPLTELISFDTADGIYDLAWSESHDSLLIAAVADGSVKLYDTALLPPQNPLRSFQEHTREVHSIDYNPKLRDSFISSSWDDTIKLWTLDRPASIRTFKEHAYCVHSAVWNSRHTDVFASASGDRTV